MKKLLLLIVLAAVYLAWALLRPLPALQPSPKTVNLSFNSGTSSLVWPASGESAVGILGSNILQTHGLQKPVPTASTAKLITSLVVLKKYPLAVGDQGPLITLGPDDVALYSNYLAKGGSTVPVAAGEQIHEYQMLEAMLLPSANNMADSLAIWAFGNLSNYTAAANAFVKQQGLASTVVGSDASGFMPNTVSTAHDLVRLGELAMQNPIIAKIVNQPVAADIPLEPNAKNVNFLLGTSGIVGIKTGNTDQAGGVYVAAARVSVNQKPVTIVTALMGSPTLYDALKFSLPLVQSAEANFTNVKLVKAGEVIGRYKLPEGNTVAAVAAQSLQFATWKGVRISAQVQLPAIKSNARINQTVSQVTARESATGMTMTAAVKLGKAPSPPSLKWRLENPL